MSTMFKTDTGKKPLPLLRVLEFKNKVRQVKEQRTKKRVKKTAANKKKQDVLFYSAGSELSRHEKPLGSTREKKCKMFPCIKNI